MRRTLFSAVWMDTSISFLVMAAALESESTSLKKTRRYAKSETHRCFVLIPKERSGSASAREDAIRLVWE